MFNNNRDDFAPQGAQTAAAPAGRRRPRRVRRDRAREARPAIVRPVNVLAVVHGANCPPGAFRTELERRGHEVDEWSLAWGSPPPRPIDDYGAVMIFGGSMHADQDDHHPWLRDEQLFLQRLLDLHMPLLGVCLGSQLIAKAAHARRRRARDARGRLDRHRADGGGRGRPGVLGASRAVSRPSSGTSTGSTSLPAASSSRAATAAPRPSGSARSRGASSSTPRSHDRSSRRGWPRRRGDRRRAEEFLAAFDEHAEEWQALGRAALRQLRRGRRARRRARLGDTPSARAAGRRSATIRATSRRSCAPGNRLREAPRSRAPSAIRSGSTRRPRAGFGQADDDRAPRPAAAGCPGHANSVETSTFRAPGIWPWRGSHGAPSRPRYSSGRLTSTIASSGSESRLLDLDRASARHRGAARARPATCRARPTPVSSSPSQAADAACQHRDAWDGRRARPPAPPTQPTRSGRRRRATSRSSPVIPWRRRRSPASSANARTTSSSVNCPGAPTTSGIAPGRWPRACAFGPRTSATTRSSSPRCSASQPAVDDGGSSLPLVTRPSPRRSPARPRSPAARPADRASPRPPGIDPGRDRDTPAPAAARGTRRCPRSRTRRRRGKAEPRASRRARRDCRASRSSAPSSPRRAA